MAVEKEQEVNEKFSDVLRCPYCEHPFLLRNALGISSQQDPCRHLVVFDPVFSTRIRVSEDSFEVSEDLDLEEIIEKIPGELTLVHDSQPEERLSDEGWTAVYHRSPGQAVAVLREFLD